MGATDQQSSSSLGGDLRARYGLRPDTHLPEGKRIEVDILFLGGGSAQGKQKKN